MLVIPDISILIPVRNGLPYLQECLNSVLSQNWKNWEMLISDNVSTDGTQDYLDTLADPRIKIFKQDENIGIFGNLNFLLEKAIAPIAKILCADDTFLPGGLEATLRFMEERPKCAVSRCWSVGDSVKFSQKGAAHLEGELPEYIRPEAAALAFATFGNLVGNLSKAACRPKLVLEVGGFNQQYPYAGDYEGWIRVAFRFGLYLQNEELIVERVHESQNSNLLNRKNELIPQLNAILTTLATHVPQKDLPVLRQHWSIHHLSPRLSRSLRQALAGDFQLAALIWKNLPLKISVSQCIAAYPIWKFGLPLYKKTTIKLLSRIHELSM